VTILIAFGVLVLGLLALYLNSKLNKAYLKSFQLSFEDEEARCKFFNETLSSNMKEEFVHKQKLDNKPGPVKWIKRDI
jgi:hypothetical protein